MKEVNEIAKELEEVYDNYINTRDGTSEDWFDHLATHIHNSEIQALIKELELASQVYDRDTGSFHRRLKYRITELQGLLKKWRE